MKIKSIDKFNNLKEYDVILTYHDDLYNKDYLVYTDNIYTDNQLQIYINEYNKNDLNTISRSIKDIKEYNYIKTKINSILLTIKNEQELLSNN